MAGQQAIQVKVLNQQGIVYEGLCQVLFVPTKKEEVAILPLHTPLIMMLTEGDVSVVINGAKRVISRISTGIVYVGENEASVLISS